MSKPEANAAAFQSRVLQLRKEALANPSTLQSYLRGLLLKHIERVSSQHLGSPGYAASTVLWSAILDEGALETACLGIETLMRQAYGEGAHVWESYRLPALLLIVSAVPTIKSEDVRSFFDRGYLNFLQDQGFLEAALRGNVVHWIACSDGERTSVHINTLPVDRTAIPILPTDLLSMEERANIGMI